MNAPRPTQQTQPGGASIPPMPHFSTLMPNLNSSTPRNLIPTGQFNLTNNGNNNPNTNHTQYTNYSHNNSTHNATQYQHQYYSQPQSQSQPHHNTPQYQHHSQPQPQRHANINHNTPQYQHHSQPPPSGIQSLGLLQVSSIQKTLFHATTTDNPDLDLFALILKKYGYKNIAAITVDIKQYVSLDKKYEAIRIPAKYTNQHTDLNLQKNSSTSHPDETDIEILNHTKKGGVPVSVKRRANEIETKEKQAKQNTKMRIEDSGVEEQQFLAIFKWMIMHQSVGKRNVSIGSGFSQETVQKVLNVLDSNGIITFGGRAGAKRYPCITGRIDNTTKRYKPLDKATQIDKILKAKYTEYTQEYNQEQQNKQQKERAMDGTPSTNSHGDRNVKKRTFSAMIAENVIIHTDQSTTQSTDAT
eukprot:149946_1